MMGEGERGGRRNGTTVGVLSERAVGVTSRVDRVVRLNIDRDMIADVASFVCVET